MFRTLVSARHPLIAASRQLTLATIVLLTMSSSLAADGKSDTKSDTKTKSATVKKGDKKMSMPVVVMETSMGKIEIELNSEKAPISSENFLKYVDAGHYDGTIFHRVIPNFMIQGGGHLEDMKEKGNLGKPIKNEATNGLKNLKGTLAMARTSEVDSATAQFFINVTDNSFLDHTSPTPSGYGYAVFGKVISGMDVVEQIKAVPTGNKGMHQNVPTSPVLIKSIKRK